MRASPLLRFVFPLVAALPATFFACGPAEPEPAAPTPTLTSAKSADSVTFGAGPTLLYVPMPPTAAPPVADASLLPRKVVFGNPDHARPRISPDGKRLAWLAPSEGVLNVWVAPADDLEKAQVVTHDKSRGIRTFHWTYSDQRLLYLQDKGGDENFHVFMVDVAKGSSESAKDLTPIDGAKADVMSMSHRKPHELLVVLNDRDKRYFDIHRVDLKTGTRTFMQKADEGIRYFWLDDDLAIRFAQRMTNDGGFELLEPDPKAKPGKDGIAAWTQWTKVPFEDESVTGVVGFDGTGKTVFMKDGRSRDTAALFAVDVATKKAKLLAEDDKADVKNVVLHPKDGHVQAATSERERMKWHVVDKALQPDFDYLRTVNEGDVEIVSQSLDDKRWVVAFTLSDAPTRFYLYDRGAKPKATFLFTNNASLEKRPLTRMHPTTIKSRDGLDLVSYLSLPRTSDPDNKGRPKEPLPMVLLVHGGPWARDSFGLNGNHQWLSSRGYAVLSVNYRGSTGFGKKFTLASKTEWAGKMHDDLIDAVEWAIREKIARKDKVAIMGGSYGGYAALVGLTFTPDRFACGVDIVGPSNLVTLLSTIPPYWFTAMEQFKRLVGDPKSDEGKKMLLERSPITYVDKIARPLLIGQGANDPRVKQAESDQIVKAMKAKSLPVTYVLYPDEGHGFARPENRISFFAVTEIFLAQCLGGPYQPIGDDFKGSSVSVPEGATNVFGLSNALAK